jgi:uncharacterized protein
MKKVLSFFIILIFTSVAYSQSFDCDKAATYVEKKICEYGNFKELDSLLSARYHEYLKSLKPAPKRAFIASQRQWLTERDNCTDNQCIESIYKARLLAITVMLREMEYQLGGNAFDNNGIMADEHKKPVSGLVKEYNTYRLVSETEYKNGLLNGTRKVYHSWGENTLWYEIPYINNKKHGLSQRYYDSYRASEKNKLLGLIPYVNDKKHGKEIWYYRDGSIETEIEFSNGKKNGSQKIYDQAGNLTKELFFRDDKEVSAE